MMNEKEYMEKLLQIELAEICLRTMLIEQAKRQADADRAARHANTLACGRSQSPGTGIRRQTQFYAVYREIPAHDTQG